MLAAILTYGILLTSCTNEDSPVIPDDEIEAQLDKMTLKEKIGQMFYVRLESLDTTIHWNTYADLQKNPMHDLNKTIRGVNAKYPIGGLILYAWNIQDEPQLAKLISDIRALNGKPLLCDPTKAYHAGNVIGNYLTKYGFDIDFAPVADVNTNPDNVIIGDRAFSDKPEVAAPMVVSYLQGLKDAGVTGCVKHFPGHGDTKTDTHFGYASTQKTWAEMLQCEMVTFKAGIDWGCQLIMTAHIGTPNVTGSDVPATMSSVILQDKLRGELGYQNIIITDGMEMGAITTQYTRNSIKAGVDIVLGPKNFVPAFEAVLKAVEKGTITEERINQSVRRILKMKKQHQG